MLPPLRAPKLCLSIEVLTAEAFADFGDVIQNPGLSSTSNDLPFNAILANQGTAVKLVDIADVQNEYDSVSKPIMTIFACSPRKLRKIDTHYNFDVEILERHPFTSQTFIPIGLAAANEDTCFLVIVAPTASSSVRSNDASFKSGKRPTAMPGPDLNATRAFIGRGNQAVNYRAGTWHAPMVALGAERIDFVVVQSISGIAEEDCQEIEIRAKSGCQGITVPLDSIFEGTSRASRL